MKKLLFLIIFFGIFLTGCSNDETDLTEVDTLRFGDIKLSPQNATIDDDGNLVVKIKWIRGSDEDSMNKDSFVSSGIIFLAEQNGVYLEDVIDSGTFMYSEVYDATENNIYVKFKPDNFDEDVEITVQDVAMEKEKTFVVPVPK